MKVRQQHKWHVNPQEAREIQRKLANKVISSNIISQVRFIAGVDISTTSRQSGIAAVVVISYPEFRIIEIKRQAGDFHFPYIPGLLSFREAPLMLAALGKLEIEPNLIMVDGQGLAHPRRFGIASHLGLILNMPTIGCAKSRLCGSFTSISAEMGSYCHLIDDNQVIGAVLRTKRNTKPVFVSIGYNIDLNTAIDWVLRSCQGFRLPEPCRLAHLAAIGKLYIK